MDTTEEKRDLRDREVVSLTLKYLSKVSDYMSGDEAYLLATRLLGAANGRQWFRDEYDKARLQDVESEALEDPLAYYIKH